MKAEKIIKELKSLANPQNVDGMVRFGISPHNTLGVSVVTLRKIAKNIGKDHSLALELWQSGIHEARILAAFVDVPLEVTEEQMDTWVRTFDSWDVCDQVCSNLFDKTPYAFKKAHAWAEAEQEFVKRAGFAMMAVLAVHDKNAKDEIFLRFFPLIKKESTDDRNFVRKAVNWALRQIGKRNSYLLGKAIILAFDIEKSNSKSARWIAKDALRELQAKKSV